MQRWFVAGGLLIVPVLLIGQIMARMFPPPSATFSGARIAHLLSEHPTEIQVGCLLMMAGFVLYGSWGAVITVWIWRIESGKYPILTLTSAILLGAQVLIFELIPMTWATAAFRATSIAPDITRMLNDWAWFNYLYTWPAYTLWLAVIAIAILRDDHSPAILPRWLGWLTLAVGLSAVPAGLMGFNKSGPFSMSGAVTFYLPLIGMLIWFFPMSHQLFKVIAKEEGKLSAHLENEPAFAAT